jgi:hypothetical protein
MKAKLLWIAAALLLVCDGARAEAPEKIVLVILENTSFADAVAAPFIGGVIAKQGVLLTDYHAISHPSEPNYLALVGGSTFAITDNNNHIVQADSVADLLEANAKSWHVYAEGYPGRCFLGATRGRYALKHNPLLSFSNIQNDANRCANVTDAKNFVNDFTHRRIADFTMYIPDLDNDGHDKGVKYADNWLSKTFGPLLQNTAAMQGVMVVVTFDEGDGPTNHVFTALYGPGVKAGMQISARYDHYSLLRTIEDIFGLGSLGKGDSMATSITGFLK